MTAERLAALKAYCHVDHDEDDALLARLYAAAMDYLTGAGVAPCPGNPLYDLATDSLTLLWYDGNDNTAIAAERQKIIVQLALRAIGPADTVG